MVNWRHKSNCRVDHLCETGNQSLLSAVSHFVLVSRIEIILRFSLLNVNHLWLRLSSFTLESTHKDTLSQLLGLHRCHGSSYVILVSIEIFFCWIWTDTDIEVFVVECNSACDGSLHTDICLFSICAIVSSESSFLVLIFKISSRSVCPWIISLSILFKCIS